MRGKKLLRGLTGRRGRAEFLEPRFDGATRLPDCLRDVIVCHLVELRQDAVTSLKQFPQKVGLPHDANLAAVRLLKTVSFRQSLLDTASRSASGSAPAARNPPAATRPTTRTGSIERERSPATQHWITGPVARSALASEVLQSAE